MKRRLLVALAALAALLGGVSSAERPQPSGADAGCSCGVLAPTLRATGLYADWDHKVLANGVLPYAPQYPLWTDGASKRRWIQIPPGAAIDGSNPDVWGFPVGTRLWKEFAFERRVETRYMERTPSGWLFATYVWNADESEAVLAPPRGLTSTAEASPGVRHDIPGELECRGCHEASGPVLGLSALQLSPDRDPGALHASTMAGAIDLRGLVERGLISGVPDRTLREPPRIAARSATQRIHG